MDKNAPKLITYHNDDFKRIELYDVSNSKHYDSSYYIAMFNNENNEVYYSYFEDMNDMFYFYNVLIGEQ